MKENKVEERLKEISKLATDCTLLHSIDYGDVEAWNLVTCYIQNAQDMKNDLITHIETSIAFESNDVRQYFAGLEIKP